MEPIGSGTIPRRICIVVSFYTGQSASVSTLTIQCIAIDLVCVVKRSASYRDHVIPTAEEDTTKRTKERLDAVPARANDGEKKPIRKNTSTIL